MKDLSVDSLTPKTKAVVEYYLAHPTETYEQMSKQIGVSISRISRVLRSPRVTRLYPILARRVVREKMLPAAVKRYQDIIESSPNDAVAEKAAAKVLASEGVFDAPTISVKGEITLKHVRELQEIVRNAAEVIDTEAEEIDPLTIPDATQSPNSPS